MVKKIVNKIMAKAGYEIKRLGSVSTYFDIDPLFKSIYKEAQMKTEMESTDNDLRRERHYVLNYLLRNIKTFEGDVCEIGCWKGLSAYQIGLYLKSKHADINFYIFDSFEGLSEIGFLDKSEFDKRDPLIVRKKFACSLESVQKHLNEFSFIKYYKGWVPTRFNEVNDKKFSFVHIDVDLYQPIKDSLEFFYPRLTKKGIIVIDDYGCVQFPGARKATDDFILNNKMFFLPLPSGQAFILKD